MALFSSAVGEKPAEGEEDNEALKKLRNLKGEAQERLKLLNVEASKNKKLESDLKKMRLAIFSVIPESDGDEDALKKLKLMKTDAKQKLNDMRNLERENQKLNNNLSKFRAALIKAIPDSEDENQALSKVRQLKSVADRRLEELQKAEDQRQLAQKDLTRIRLALFKAIPESGEDDSNAIQKLRGMQEEASNRLQNISKLEKKNNELEENISQLRMALISKVPENSNEDDPKALEKIQKLKDLADDRMKDIKKHKKERDEMKKDLSKIRMAVLSIIPETSDDGVALQKLKNIKKEADRKLLEMAKLEKKNSQLERDLSKMRLSLLSAIPENKKASRQDQDKLRQLKEDAENKLQSIQELESKNKNLEANLTKLRMSLLKAMPDSGDDQDAISRIQDLKKLAGERLGAVNTLQNEKITLENDLGKLRGNLMEFEPEVENEQEVFSKLRGYKRDAQNLEEELVKSKRKNQKLEDEVSKFRMAIFRLVPGTQDDLEALEQLKDLKSNNEGKMKDFARLEAEKNSLNKDLDKLTENLMEAVPKSKSTSDALMKIRKMNLEAGSRAEDVDKLRNDNQQMESDLSSIKRALFAAVPDTSNEITAITKLHDIKKEAETAQADIRRLDREKKIVSENLSKLKQAVADAVPDTDDQEQAIAQLGQLSLANKDRLKVLEDAHAENLSLKNKVREFENLEKEATRLRKENAKMKAKNKNQFIRQQSTINEIRGELGNTKGQKAALEMKNKKQEQLEQDLEGAREEIEEMEERLSKVQEEKKELERDNFKIKPLQEEIQSKKEEIKRLKENQRIEDNQDYDLMSTKNEIEAKDKLIRDLETQITKLKAEMKVIKDEKGNEIRKMKMQRMGTLKNEDNAKNQEVKLLKDDIRKLKTELAMVDTMKRELEGRSDEIRQLKAESDRFKAEKQAMESKKREIENQKEELRKLKYSKSSDVQKDLEKTLRELESKTKELKNLQRAFDVVQNDKRKLENLQGDLKLKDKEVANLMKQNTKIERQNTVLENERLGLQKDFKKLMTRTQTLQKRDTMIADFGDDDEDYNDKDVKTLREEKYYYQKQAERLNQVLRDLANKDRDLQDAIKSNEKMTVELKRLKGAKHDLDSTENQNRSMASKMEKLERENKELYLEAEKNNKMIQELERSKESIRSQNNKDFQRLESFKMKTQEKEDIIKDVKSQLSGVQREKEKMRLQVRSLEREIEHLEAEQEKSRRSQLEMIENRQESTGLSEADGLKARIEVDRLTAENEILKEEIAKLRTTYGALEVDLEFNFKELEKTIRDCKKLDEENGSLRNRLMKVERELQFGKKEESTQNERVLSDQNKFKDTRIRELENEISALRANKRDAERLRKDLSRLKQRYDELNSEKDSQLFQEAITQAGGQGTTVAQLVLRNQLLEQELIYLNNKMQETGTIPKNYNDKDADFFIDTDNLGGKSLF